MIWLDKPVGKKKIISNMNSKLTRRKFLTKASSAGIMLPLATVIARADDAIATNAGEQTSPAIAGGGGFVDILRNPDLIEVFTEAGVQSLKAASDGGWRGEDVEISAMPAGDALDIALSAPASAVKRVHLRWRGSLRGNLRFLGDAWERAYGDLEWRGVNPDRVMPWYFLIHDGDATHGFGVKTGPRAFCFWMADSDGISLWADVRSGGVGVQLGARRLEVCSVVSRKGQSGESSFAAQRALCRRMCPNPRLPKQPVYGANDWYYAYGKNTAVQILEDSRRIAALSPSKKNRPFSVIDDGWESTNNDATGPWDKGNDRFGSMQKLAEEMRAAGVKPGIWTRPLLVNDVPAAWRMKGSALLDPSLADVKQVIAANISRLRQWGYELIKHDYSTYDILGRWGLSFGATLTDDGWTFKGGRSQTTAEVVLDLYNVIRTAAGDAVIIGCNTLSHLTAGIFEASRIGDDTSGRDWDRTRRMGVNSLAFRAAQSGAFYAADADCVGLTNAIPWELNRRWLDLLSRSGTVLFVSAQKEATGPEQQKALKEAFSIAAEPQPLGEPLDWMETTSPRSWLLCGEKADYDWNNVGGASPFS